MSRPEIKLEHHEISLGAITGVRRQIMCLKRRGTAGHDSVKRGWQDHCDGAIGELAFAKYLGVYWGGSVGTFLTVPDVAAYEVRTNAAHWGDLIIRERDKADETAYVLVLSHAIPTFTMAGWMTGADARQDKWYRRGDVSRPPAWFVPQSALRPMEELPRG